jgi:choline-sulfatase
MTKHNTPQFGAAPKSLDSYTAKVHRRDFIKLMGGAGALAAAHGMFNFWPGQALADTIAQRRNVIIFTTDQQQELRWFPPGWEEANLPGLTRLRNKGVSFTRAYTNAAMCTPARTTLFTGLYPAQHQNVDTLSEGNSQSEQEHQLDPTIPNIGTVLQAAGYDVVWKGKWHLSKGIDHPDGAHSDDDISRYGMSDWNAPDAGGDAKLKNYGGGTTNHDGRFFDGTTWQEPVGDPSDPNYIFTQADGPVNAEFEAESVMSFLRWKINNPGGNPFCLIVCLINPHDVLGCPGRSVENGGNGTYIEGGYYGREDNTSPWSEQTGPLTIEVPPTRSENLTLNLKPSCQFGMLLASAALGPVPTDDLKLQYLNFYANLMKLNDKRLVKMLDLLDGVDGTVNATAARALRDNSWIVFTSDHGDMAMTHGGLRQKSFMAYEEMANIPLVWSNPVDFPAGVECHELVSHVDMMPTLCALLNIDGAPYAFKGVDYSSLIHDHTAPAVQSSVLFSFDDINSGQESGGSTNGVIPAPNRVRALIEKDYKYALYFDGTGEQEPQDEFYDLRNDSGGGTDTDTVHGFGSTGKAIEYINYSTWAENLRLLNKKATPSIESERDRMEVDLAAAMAAKLTPRTPGQAAEPENFKIAAYQWVDENQEEQQAVQVTWLSRCTTQYQMQQSEDMITWTNVGEAVHGNNGPMWLNQQVAGKMSYRLVWSPFEEAPIPSPV